MGGEGVSSALRSVRGDSGTGEASNENMLLPSLRS